MKFKKLSENAHRPTQGTPGSAGWDLYAIEDTVILPSGLKYTIRDDEYVPGEDYKDPDDEQEPLVEATLVRTGIAMEIPEGFFGLLVPRSSMGKKGVRLSTGASIIDSDYRGEIMAYVWNDGNKPYTIKSGERVVQIVILPYGQTYMEEVKELSETGRSGGGFGSTGR